MPPCMHYQPPACITGISQYPHSHPVGHIVSVLCIISSFALSSAEALTHDVCEGKDTKTAAAPEESASDADESEGAEEAGPSSKDLAKETPVGGLHMHGCCVWSSDLVLCQCIVGQCGLACALFHVAKYSIGCVHCIFRCRSFHAHTAPFKTVACCRYSTLQQICSAL